MEEELKGLDGKLHKARHAMIKAEDTCRGVAAKIIEKRAKLGGESDKELKDLEGELHKAYGAVSKAEDTFRGIGAKMIDKRAKLDELRKQHM